MAATPLTLQPGQLFAGCRVERLIGQGASGTVYAVLDGLQTDPQAGPQTGPSTLWRALKIHTPAPGLNTAAAAESRDRFLREAAIAARLSHPDILRVHRSGQTDGRPWLVMDLLTGTDLSRYAQPARLLPEAVVLDTLARVADALAHAHERGVIHRDLKPANVIVDWAAGLVRLTDFGLASTADAQATRTGLVLGSPAYMAPELLAGAAPSAASDLYAWGAMLFQLLTGQLPFDAPGMGELLRQVATVPAPDLRRVRPDLSALAGEAWADQLNDLVASLLAKSPAERPGPAATLAARARALRDRLAGTPSHAGAGPKSRG